MITVCCDAFGLHYVPISHHTVKFEQDDVGKWNIEGCCLACYVVHDMKFCPYCGTKIGFEDNDEKKGSNK
jgi:rRNA maturation endonuclease Nob1